jgi:hypothetical protein
MKPILILTQTSIQDILLIEYLKPIYHGHWILPDYTSKNDFKEDLANLNIEYAKITNIYLGDLDQLSLSFQQSILKFLEEPPHNLRIIMTKATEYKLLPTIKSRVDIRELEPPIIAQLLDPQQLDRVKKLFPTPAQTTQQLINGPMNLEDWGNLADIERTDIIFYLWQLEYYLTNVYANTNSPRTASRIQDVLLAKQNILDNLQKKIALCPLLF